MPGLDIRRGRVRLSACSAEGAREVTYRRVAVTSLRARRVWGRDRACRPGDGTTIAVCIEPDLSPPEHITTESVRLMFPRSDSSGSASTGSRHRPLQRHRRHDLPQLGSPRRRRRRGAVAACLVPRGHEARRRSDDAFDDAAFDARDPVRASSARDSQDRDRRFRDVAVLTAQHEGPGDGAFVLSCQSSGSAHLVASVSSG